MTKDNIKNNLHRAVVVMLLAAMAAIMLSSLMIANSSAAESCPSGNFLGFPAWYRGLNCSGSPLHVDLKDMPINNAVMIVGLNVLDILIRLVSIIATGFVIWGGIQYLISHGEPRMIANAKQTITRALIGLVIGILSVAVVNFLIARIGG